MSLKTHIEHGGGGVWMDLFISVAPVFKLSSMNIGLVSKLQMGLANGPGSQAYRI